MPEHRFEAPPEDPEKTIHLRDYFKVLRKRQFVIIFFFLCTFISIALFTFLSIPHYEAKSKVMIEQDAGSDLTGRYSPASRSLGFYETQLQLIQSRAVARRVVDLLSLGEESAYIFGLDEEDGGSFSVNEWVGKILAFAEPVFGKNGDPGESLGRESKPLPLKDRMANAIIENLSVDPVAESRIVVVSFASPNPEFAALIANTTAKAYVEETLDMKMEATRRSLEWMTKKAEAERQKLAESEKALHAYMKANDIITLENRLTVTPEELSEISTQLVRAESERKRVEALYRKVRSIESAETVSAITADPSLRALRAQIVEAEKTIMELSGKYGKKHPVMEKVLGDLRILKSKKDQEVERLVQSIKNEYELALSNERSLRSQLKKSKGNALRLNEKFVQYGVLKREVDTNKQLYDALMMKIKEQNITEENNPVNVWIVEEAQVPDFPAKPQKKLNLALGMFLGLFGGITLAFFAEYLDNSVKDPEEAEAILGIPVLGMVPLGKGKKKMEEIVVKDPLSGIAEGYKALRSTLLLSSADAPPRKILVSSSATGEGKTTTAVNLAFVMAQAENRVLLLDGDLRKPRLHQIFNLDNQFGLSNYLAGNSNGSKLLQKTSLPNLAVLPSGPIPPNPAELLLSQRMKKLIESLEQEFDIIICDSPPVLTVSDPGILSRLFDGTILVIRAHKTTFEMAGKSIRSLRDVHARLLGTMLNGVNLRKGDYYYSDYYMSRPRKENKRITSEIGNA